MRARQVERVHRVRETRQDDLVLLIDLGAVGDWHRIAAQRARLARSCELQRHRQRGLLAHAKRYHCACHCREGVAQETTTGRRYLTVMRVARASDLGFLRHAAPGPTKGIRGLERPFRTIQRRVACPVVDDFPTRWLTTIYRCGD